MPGIASFQQLRQQRHAQWLADLKQRINAVLDVDPGDAAWTGQTASPDPTERPDQIYLFGSRARGDWDGLSDTDLLVVARSTREAECWADRLLDQGVARDVIGLDRDAWRQLPQHSSVIWRHVARDAQPLLDTQPSGVAGSAVRSPQGPGGP
ncbi:MULTISPECIES: nucleotidyltransferase domain-containing protein [unclassified Synechococcus]|uniref:nucleotidyltransferase domain-containing protein n=1 Tax=unclassified Synechococcus TaxID=2626047 RepID=UPI0018CF3A28|nr:MULTISPECIES: nucleotidyltransferase domain-containing protein [unclassified Synechococcus]MEA5422643.1 nucleotidyltransferase domain-containing protein [Synechococcus sp. CCY9202]QPN65866.1 nucleotidyltransferase domain-containing protein [Synechococcus sp. CBW1006]